MSEPRLDDLALRVAIAEDSTVLRQGISAALGAVGIDVVIEAGDGAGVLRELDRVQPDVAVLDMRMPPTHTNEGLLTAQQIRAEHPAIGVLLLSAAVDAATARQLLASSSHGVGYLRKDRIMEIGALTAALRTVASGGAAIDPEVLGLLA